MRARLVGLSVLLTLVAAPDASATVTSSFSTGTLTVNSDESGDQINLACVSNVVLLNGANPPSGELLCEGGSTTLGRFVVNGNGGADAIDVSGLLADSSLGDSSADGGAGDDQVEGFQIPSAPDEMTLLGGPGNDVIVTNEAELSKGGSGDDRFEGVAEQEGGMDGEGGTDTVVYDVSTTPPGFGGGFTFAPTDGGLNLRVGEEAVTAPWASIEVADLTLTDAPQTVDGRAFSGTMIVRARDGADTIYGTELADTLDGGAGNDFIEGLGGSDTYQGGSGFDLIHARDGVADTGDCGSDADTLVADAIDSLVGCEQIELPPAGRDTTKPKLKLKRALLEEQRSCGSRSPVRSRRRAVRASSPWP